MNKGEGTIKPCPFCDGEASGDAKARYSNAEENGWDQDEFYYCNCTRCGANNKGLVGHKTREVAIEKWNRRTPDTHALEVRVMELEAALQAMLDDFRTDSCPWPECVTCKKSKWAYDKAHRTLHPQDSQEVGND